MSEQTPFVRVEQEPGGITFRAVRVKGGKARTVSKGHDTLAEAEAAGREKHPDLPVEHRLRGVL